MVHPLLNQEDLKLSPPFKDWTENVLFSSNLRLVESDPQITRDLQTGGILMLQLRVLHSERGSEGLRVFLAAV